MANVTVDRTQLVSAFRRQYELCKVRPGESVAFLADLNSDQDIVTAGLIAAAELGIAAYEIRIARGPNLEIVGENPLNAAGVIEAVRNASLVVTFFVGFFSPWERAVRAAGGRILNLLDTPDELVRLQGSPELKKAVIAARDRVLKTTNVRVTSEAGTDFSWVRDAKQPLFYHYGFADEPGKMDHWGQGMVAMFSEEGSAHGRVVVKPGDV
jgi:2,5-dihydroxypyridine 5,6-dioxygenase